ncbi:MAG: prenyltransferase [Thalassotalea sp.]|nr:prenyltransferase [Thalassotalea sp.]
MFTYTKWLNKSPFLCLIAPGIGFGLLMVVGAYLTQTLSYNQDVWLISLIPFFLINNLLLLNQFPDIQADKKSGRNHLAIKYGTKFASGVYIFFASSSMMVLCFLIFNQTLPYLSLICLLPLSLSFIAFPKIFSLGENIAQNPRTMILNVVSTNLTPLLLAISLFIAG